MARSDEAELAIRLEAKIRDFQRNLDRAQRAANQNFKRIETDAEKSASRLESTFAKAGKGMSAGLKAGLAGLAAGGIAGIIGRARDLTREVANVSNEAKRAGLSSKAFQELGYVARQNRIDVDALVDGMKELSLRADEFRITGAGPAAEAFKRLGFTATELSRKLKDPSALLVEIIGKLERFDKASQIRIADEIFGGTGGERFVELLDRGADGVRTLIKEANDFGIIMDDAMIKRADELDRKFQKITETVSTGLKRAVVDVVDGMGEFFDQFNKLEEQADRTIQKQLQSIYGDRQALIERIAELKGQRADSFFPGAIDGEIKVAEAGVKRLTDEAMRLRDVLDRRSGYSENFVFQAGDEAKDAAPKVTTLNEAVAGMNSAGASGASGINSFAEAIRSLKNEIPGLTGQLAEMDARTRINGAYRAALQKATSIGDTIRAEKLRDEALSALSIKTATTDSAGYLSGKLASGKPKSYVLDMEADFADALAKMLASAPDAVRAATTINSGARSVRRQAELFDAAVKKYGSEAAARKWVAPPGKSQHNRGTAADLDFQTDEARNWFHDNASSYGLTFPMKHEPWHIESASARRQADDETFMADRENKAELTKAKTQALRDQVLAYGEIVASARQFIGEQGMEQQALGISATAAAKLRYEHAMLAEAQRAGIALTPQQRAQISALAGEMANGEAAAQGFADEQDKAKQAAEKWRNFGLDLAKGFVADLRAGKSAGEAFANVLDKIASKLIDMAINNLFANAFGGEGGGGFFALIGKLFGFKDGGIVEAASGGYIRGPGTSTSDSIPARLSDGEFVVNAAATKRNRALLEAVNSGDIQASAAGGLVGAAPISSPRLGSTAGASAPIAITSNVTLNANGGDPKQNADLARQTAAAVDAQMRAIVQQELRNATRPGGGFDSIMGRR
ncbi:M15 family metallopeptidase [Jiella marina]|uniref:M15 family metallopeptidase n=1 Tax=Jiella sp. LLJ827 TaxID=2917712 RepID=UPI00210154B0|nr:D-alanyl-D-alanine carboxypeptidase family protein [Jiella sp. LLJ827]MCQ0989938.1 D-alanyl-D-alanine carboxypeptidase family protein [Jiella sp. LLJ827]